MPQLLDRLKKSIMKYQNIPEWKAIVIATSVLEKNWYMKDWKLTARWLIKQKLKEWVHWIPKKK